jgi:DNA-binding IclR family transcriptional regulator
VSAPNVPAALARTWAVLDVLNGHAFEGLRNQQIADAVSQSASTTLRDLQALEALGRVERIPGREECWRLSPRIVQMAIAHQNELARLQQRVDDFSNRYSRSNH